MQFRSSWSVAKCDDEHTLVPISQREPTATDPKHFVRLPNQLSSEIASEPQDPREEIQQACFLCNISREYQNTFYISTYYFNFLWGKMCIGMYVSHDYISWKVKMFRRIYSWGKPFNLSCRLDVIASWFNGGDKETSHWLWNHDMKKLVQIIASLIYHLRRS